MLTLPHHPGRVTIRTFWIAISVFVGIVVAIMMNCQLALGVLFVMVLCGFLVPPLMELSYRIWNRVARVLGRLGKAVVAWILFYFVIVPLRFGGSSFHRGRSGEPGASWMFRETLAADSYAALHQFSGDSGGGGAVRSLASWAVRNGEWRLLLMIPFLVLMSALSDEEGKEAPENIYTLF